MFKKILCATIALILVCLCPLSASADMGAPYFEEITYTVDNSDGIDAYSYNWDMNSDSGYLSYYCKLPFGTTVTITGETVIDNIAYGYIYYANESLYVKLSDIQMGSDIVKPIEGYKLDEPSTLVVINSDGVGLHAGPSFAYNKLATIPYGTELEYQYSAETWVYVTYNGTSAWVYNYQYGSPYNTARVLEKSEKLMVIDNATYLTETPDPESAKVTGAIPKGTVLSYKYSFQWPKSCSVFVEYNGKKGWVTTKDSFSGGTASESDGCIAIVNSNGVKLYSEAKTSGEVIATVPANTLLPVDFELWNEYGDEGEPFCYYYVSYNGSKGWIRSYSDDTAASYGNFNEYTVDASSLPIYTSTNINSDIISYLTAGQTVTVIINTTFFYDYGNESWALVYNDGYYGWVYEDGSVMTYKKMIESFSLPASAVTIGTKISPDSSSGEITTEPTTDDNNAPGITDNGTSGNKLALTPLKIFIICLGGAFILFITAIVLIIIIVKVSKNKKKKRQAAQQMNAPVNPQMNRPMNPPVNPQMNHPMNPPANPQMNRPMNPPANAQMNQQMNAPVNPQMNQPMNPPVNPQMNQPTEPPANSHENIPTDSEN